MGWKLEVGMELIFSIGLEHGRIKLRIENSKVDYIRDQRGQLDDQREQRIHGRCLCVVEAGVYQFSLVF